MFQNETIAKDHGNAIRDEALRAGATLDAAEIRGDQAARRKLAELDEWTRENVGLD